MVDMPVEESVSLAACRRGCKQAFDKLSSQLRNAQYVGQLASDTIQDQSRRLGFDPAAWMKLSRVLLHLYPVYGQVILVLSTAKSLRSLLKLSLTEGFAQMQRNTYPCTNEANFAILALVAPKRFTPLLHAVTFSLMTR